MPPLDIGKHPLMPNIAIKEAQCDTYLATGRVNEAWQLVYRTITADMSLMSDHLMEVIIRILVYHQSHQTDCLEQLRIVMQILLKHPKFDDILALGTLLFWETKNTAFSVAEVDSEELMKKARQCLEVWSRWYRSLGIRILGEKHLRTKLTVTFLRKTGDLAIVNFKNCTAMNSLSKAFRIAYDLGQWNIAGAVMLAIVTVIPELGQQCVPSFYSPETQNMDVIVASVALESDQLLGHLAVASHHLKTGQLKQFMINRDILYQRFSLSLETSGKQIITFVKAVIKKLEAEFLMMPGARALEEEKEGCIKPLQYALHLARSSYKHIHKMLSTYYGNKFPRDKVPRHICSWQIIHEFLSIAKLTGELYVYAGILKKAKPYFLSGLAMADRYKLVTWGAIFSSKLVELEMLADDLDAATNMLQLAQSILCSVKSDSQSCHGKPSVSVVLTNQLGCGFTMSRLEREHTYFSRQHKSTCDNSTDNEHSDFHCCEQNESVSPPMDITRPFQLGSCEKLPTENEKSEDFRQHLLFNILKQSSTYSTDNQEFGDRYLVVTDIDSCCSCCQQEIIGAMINVMCLQAEMLQRKQKSVCCISSLLQHSLLLVNKLVKLSPCTNLIDFISDSDWEVSDLGQNRKYSFRILGQTAYRSAVIYFQNVYIRRADSHTGCQHLEVYDDSIRDLLEIVEMVGKDVSVFNQLNVTVAAAVLLKSSVSYLAVLKKLVDNDVQETEKSSGDKCGVRTLNVITRALTAAMGEKVLEEKTTSLLSSLTDQSLVIYNTRLVVNILSCDKYRKQSFGLPFNPSPGQQQPDTVGHSSSLKTCLASETAGSKNVTSTVSVCDNKDNLQTNAETACYTAPEAEKENIKDEKVPCSKQDKKFAWLKQITSMFPTMAACQNVNERTDCLLSALQQLNEMPHYLVYRQTSQSLALCLWEKQMKDAWETNQTYSNQVEIAAYLSDSMHITFQHMMTENFCSKLSTKIYRTGIQTEAKMNRKAMLEALNVLRFGGNVIEKFNTRMSSIPADWTVVQMTVVRLDPTNPGSSQILLTRLKQQQEPITIGLPSQRYQFLKCAQRAYEVGLAKCHAHCLNVKNRHLVDAQFYIQDIVLSGHKWLLRGQLDCLRQTSIQTFLDEAGKRAVNKIHQEHDYLICYAEIRNLLEILLQASETDIKSLVECVWPPHVTGMLSEIIIGVQKEIIKMCGDQWSEKRGPVILILDDELTGFPWESIPDLKTDTITRMPSFPSLIALLVWHKNMAKSPFRSGVERTSVAVQVGFYQNSLPGYSQQLVEQMKQYEGWQIDVEIPYVKKIQSALQSKSLYLFYGHSWDNYSFVQDMLGSSFAVIMCRCSGALSKSRSLDGDGVPLYFLLAGCAAVMGNLWNIYDENSTQVVSHISSDWMSQDNPVSIRDLLVSASKSTQLYGLCGSGAVIYGLPLKMN